MNFSWLLYEFNGGYVQREKYREILYLLYTTTYEVHTFKNKNKRKLLRDMFCLSFSLLYLFIPSCKFAITEARTAICTW